METTTTRYNIVDEIYVLTKKGDDYLNHEFAFENEITHKKYSGKGTVEFYNMLCDLLHKLKKNNTEKYYLWKHEHPEILKDYRLDLINRKLKYLQNSPKKDKFFVVLTKLLRHLYKTKNENLILEFKVGQNNCEDVSYKQFDINLNLSFQPKHIQENMEKQGFIYDTCDLYIHQKKRDPIRIETCVC